MMMTNATLEKFYECQTVLVRYLPYNADEGLQDYEHNEAIMNVSEEQNLDKLMLTPPIVVAWIYHLARSLTEGIISTDKGL